MTLQKPSAFSWFAKSFFLRKRIDLIESKFVFFLFFSPEISVRSLDVMHANFIPLNKSSITTILLGYLFKFFYKELSNFKKFLLSRNKICHFFINNRLKLFSIILWYIPQISLPPTWYLGMSTLTLSPFHSSFILRTTLCRLRRHLFSTFWSSFRHKKTSYVVSIQLVNLFIKILVLMLTKNG